MAIPFFSRKPKAVPAPVVEPAPAPAPKRPVGYNPGLVAALTQEHRDMLLLLDQAKGATQAQRFGDVNGYLDKLRVQLENHITRETDELHAYLIAHTKSADRLDTLKDMHSGMLRTERALQGFLKHYGGYPVTARNAAMFYKEIDGVSAEFAKWTQQEESAVYSLYWPPESY